MKTIDVEKDIQLRLAEAQISFLKGENERLQKNLDSLLKDFCAYVSAQNEEVKALCADLRTDINKLIKEAQMIDRTNPLSDELRHEFRWNIDGKPYGIIMSIKKEK